MNLRRNAEQKFKTPRGSSTLPLANRADCMRDGLLDLSEEHRRNLT